MILNTTITTGLVALMLAAPAVALRPGKVAADEDASFEDTFEAEGMISATTAPPPQCLSWCPQKVANKDRTCKKDGKEGQLCTWDILCSYKSNKCASCKECTCQDFCAKKAADKSETWLTMCGWSSNKCSGCDACKVCDDACAKKAPEQGWDKVCKWASGKCLGCDKCSKSATRPTPKPTPKPTTTDSTCKSGILTQHATNGKTYNVCCPKSCGVCGGSTCSSAPGGSEKCCLGPIEKAGKYCTSQLPPCLVPNKKVPSGKSKSGASNYRAAGALFIAGLAMSMV